MNQYFKVVTIVMVLHCGLSSCQEISEKASTEREQKKGIPLPEIPLTIATAEARNNYLVMHYWDHFDFRDTSLILKPEVTEHFFVDFIQLAQHSQHSTAGIKAMLDASTLNRSFFVHMCDLSEKYLYDPNSPMRNEELYISVLKYIIDSELIVEVDKMRSIYQLKMLLKNRLGNIAADFKYTLNSGDTGRLFNLKSEYTILFFNAPNCYDCQWVKEYIKESKVFSKLNLHEVKNIAETKLIILGIYPSVDIACWQASEYPDFMLNAYDASLTIKNEELYDLKAFPSLYLLDKDKRVLLKDAPIEDIEKWLEMNV